MVTLVHVCGCNLGPKFPVVASQQFVLQDESGNARGGIYAGKTGSGLILLDGAGRERIRLFAEDAGTGIIVRDSSGKNRVVISTADAVGMTYAVLLDANGKPTVLGAVLHEGSKPVSQEEIQRDSKRLLEKFKSGWLQGLREIDKQGH
jgi:hypothetical protein